MSVSLAQRPKRPPAAKAPLPAYSRRYGEGQFRIDWSSLPPDVRRRVNDFCIKHDRLACKATLLCTRGVGGAVDVEEVLSNVRYTLARCALRFDKDLGWKFSTFTYRSLLRAARQNVHAQRRKMSCLGRKVPRQFTEFDSIKMRSSVPSPLRDIMESEEDTIRKRFIRDAVARLSRVERYVILGRLIHARKLQEIGDAVGLSKERIRQIESSVYSTLALAWKIHQERRDSDGAPEWLMDEIGFEEMVEAASMPWVPDADLVQ